MSLNETASGNRIHIGFFGLRNAGKSSVANAVTGQDMSIVSDVKGTTTDPVSKSMELLPLGPVVVIDTAGFDDDSPLGELRMKRTRRILNRVDIAVLVLDGRQGPSPLDREFLDLCGAKGIPVVIALNKSDCPGWREWPGMECAVRVSAATGEGIDSLKAAICKSVEPAGGRGLLSGVLRPCGTVVFVVPIDESAPKDRLILPQQMAIRESLELGATALVVREKELEAALGRLVEKPDLVVTDSQAFQCVSAMVPEDVPLTSFSILMARYKGFLATALEGIKAIGGLRDGDVVLVAEGCTHHRQCNDIGTVKIPAWLRKSTGRELRFETSSGLGFPEDLSRYSLVLHCGGCMVTGREMLFRMKCAQDQGVPFTNYGLAIASMKGILDRAIRPLEGLE